VVGVGRQETPWTRITREIARAHARLERSLPAKSRAFVRNILTPRVGAALAEESRQDHVDDSQT